jgi:DNA-binding CsgD family transcriptional regulator
MIHERLNSVKLTEKQREMLNIWMDTESFTKTGEILGTTRQYVEATIKMILERLKPKFESMM